MAFPQFVNGILTECHFRDKKLCFLGSKGKPIEIDIIDIIGVTDTTSSGKYGSCDVHVIEKKDQWKKWTKGKIKFKSELQSNRKFMADLKQKIYEVKGGPKQFLVIVNPVAGSKKGLQIYNKVVRPLFDLAEIKQEIIVSQRSQHIVEIMKSHDISQKNGIILVGGDGTFYECINTLLKRHQMEAGISYNDFNAKLIPINTVFAQIPTGTLNGVSLLSTGQQDPMTSALHIIRGTTKSIGVTGLFSNGQLVSYYVLLCLVGAYADLFNALARRRFIMLIRMICTPFYHFLIKQQPSFDTEILCHESKTSKGNEDASTTISISEDVMKGVFCNMIIFAGDNTDDEFKLHPLHEGFNYDRTVMTAYDRCSRMDLMGNFMKLVGGKPETLLSDFIHKKKVTGVDVRINNDKGQFKSKELGINVDGEQVELDVPEFQIRLLGHLLTIFSSNP